MSRTAVKKTASKPIIRKPNLGLPNSPINSRDAVPAMREWSGAGRRCLQSVRESWRLPFKYGTAEAARKGAKAFHPWTGDTEDIPFGAPVWSKRIGAPADDAGHVFMAGGHAAKGDRIFWTVDAVRLGETDPVTIDFFSEKWGHEILGWAEDLNGYDLNLPLSPNERKKGRK